MRYFNLSKTITSVLGHQKHELIEIGQRRLLAIFGQITEISFVIIPGWYVGNARYDDDILTAVDVELIDSPEQLNVEQTVRSYLEKKGLYNFRISFWGAAGFPQDFGQPEHSSHAHLADSKILVVDDDPGMREIMKLFLQKEGYTVLTVSNARDAAELLRSKRERLPNLMLLDIMMPGSTGWELLKELENDPQINKIPVIAISGLEKPKHGEEYDSKMLYDYLVKPFSMQELSRVVRKFSSS